MSGKRKWHLDPKQLEEMYQRMSLRDIARHFGCGETLIWNRIKEHGITFKGAPNGRHRPREFTEQHRLNLSKAHWGVQAGEKSPRWKGGIHQKHLRIRATGEYRQWRLAARKRANDCCEGCGVANGTSCGCCGHEIKLHVHHLKSFAKFPDHRFDPANSEVLCPNCHNSRHGRKIG